MILVDSSVWIGYFNGADTWQTRWLDHALQHEVVIIGDLILAEVLQGFRSDAEHVRAEQMLLGLEVVELGGSERALRAARRYRTLRKKGCTIRKTVDLFIAEWCIEQDVALLHQDSDFEAIAANEPGFMVIRNQKSG
jgi:predicted nucleic acid-binding protein